MASGHTASLRRALPWLLSLGIVGWLASRIHLDEVGAALAHAEHGALLAWMLVFTVLTFVGDSACLTLLFRRLLGQFSFSEVLAVKGVSYFLNAVNYSAGTGSIAYFVHKRGGLPFLSALSALLWLNFVDIAALLIILGAGFWVDASLLPEDIAAQLPWVLGVGGAVVVGALVYWRLGVDFLVLGRFRHMAIFSAFGKAKMTDYLMLLGARTAFIALYVVMTYALLPTFHIVIPISVLLVYVPLLTFVQIIPASVSGLGAIQVVMVALYVPYVAAHLAGADPVETVVAFSTVVGPGVTLLRLGIGYTLLGRLAPDLVATRSELEAAQEAAGEDEVRS